MSAKDAINSVDLRPHWEAFLADGDEGALRAFIGQHCEVTVECDHAYPQRHRIADVRLGAEAFRVSRCVLCGERLTIRPIDPSAASSQEPGVPLWLTGKALRDWAQREAESPAKGPPDWDRYRAAAAAGQAPAVDGRQQQLLQNLFGKSALKG